MSVILRHQHPRRNVSFWKKRDKLELFWRGLRGKGFPIRRRGILQGTCGLLGIGKKKIILGLSWVRLSPKGGGAL